MAALTDVGRTMSRIEKLEREVNLKQLQINSLLTITQAINENVPVDGLYNMYTSFLKMEIGIRKMTLLFRADNGWECVASLSTDLGLLHENDIAPALAKFRNKQSVESSEHPFIKQFDLVLPVWHKDTPIAYVFIGGFEDEDDVYNKVQFVTTITNVIAVAIENKRLFKQQISQELLNREVELAAEIQRTLVPFHLPASEHYQLSSIYKPHFAVGGDYYDVVEFPGEGLVFCIADITGKGVPAALLMANFQANFRTLVARRVPLDEIIHEMNAAVFRITQGDRFITMFLARYDLATSTLHYYNAGHTPPILLTEGGAQRLKNGSTVLGWLPELPFLEDGHVHLDSDTLLFTFTDGLTDVHNRNQVAFGEDRILDFLQANANLHAKELNTKLLAHIEAYCEREAYPDDITVLTCKLFLR
jgi:phosphoserine phosphatase RsbU/P